MSQQNPLLQPPFFLIQGISPTSPISDQVQQIDQLNTLLLQEIDANFAKFHQIITTRILPEIKRFAIGSEPIREASEFWKAFFEQAAATRLNIEEPSQIHSDSQIHSHDSQQSYIDQTLRLDEDSYLSQAQSDGSFMFRPQGEGITTSTPLPGRSLRGGAGEGESWENSMESPFDRLDRKLRDELRLDEPQRYAESDSMPTPSLPSGYSLPRLDDGPDYDVSTGTVEPVDLPSYPSHQSQRLHQVQQSQQSQQSYHSQRSTRNEEGEGEGATPKAKGKQVDKGWNGLTDLRSTPLNAKFKKPQSTSGAGTSHVSAKDPKTSLANTLADLTLDDSDDEIHLPMSPPVTMTFKLPPRAQAIADVGRQGTPRKGASHDNGVAGSAEQGQKEGEARLILDDLMREMESGYHPSPRMPTPEGLGRYSIMPGEGSYGTGGMRLFEDEINQSNNQPSGSTRIRRSMANTSYGSDIIDQPSSSHPAYSNETHHGAGEDDGDYSFDDEDDSFDSVAQTQQPHQHQQQQYVQLDQLGDDESFMSNSPGPDRPYQHHEGDPRNTNGTATHGYSTIDSGNTSEAGMIFGKAFTSQHPQGFNLMKQDEMNTFFGGKLEDAAGKEVELSPSNNLARGGGGAAGGVRQSMLGNR